MQKSYIDSKVNKSNRFKNLIKRGKISWPINDLVRWWIQFKSTHIPYSLFISLVSFISHPYSCPSVLTHNNCGSVVASNIQVKSSGISQMRVIKNKLNGKWEKIFLTRAEMEKNVFDSDCTEWLCCGNVLKDSARRFETQRIVYTTEISTKNNFTVFHYYRLY